MGTYGEILYQVLPSDLFECFKWPFQGLSDLHLGDQKVTWKKLVGGGFKYFLFSTFFGEDFQFDEHIFQMGWNHQPVLLSWI